MGKFKKENKAAYFIILTQDTGIYVDKSNINISYSYKVVYVFDILPNKKNGVTCLNPSCYALVTIKLSTDSHNLHE